MKIKKYKIFVSSIFGSGSFIIQFCCSFVCNTLLLHLSLLFISTLFRSSLISFRCVRELLMLYQTLLLEWVFYLPCEAATRGWTPSVLWWEERSSSHCVTQHTLSNDICALGKLLASEVVSFVQAQKDKVDYIRSFPRAFLLYHFNWLQLCYSFHGRPHRQSSGIGAAIRALQGDDAYLYLTLLSPSQYKISQV